MKILRAFWDWLFEDTPVTTSWLKEKQYDRSGWEGPTFHGRFKR